MKINDEARATLLDEVTGLGDEELNKRPSTGGWSIAQVMEHLYLMERAVVYNIQNAIENSSIKEVSSKPIELTVNRSRKVEAPEFVQPSESTMTLKDLQQKLQTSHEALRGIYTTVDEKRLVEKTAVHPVFGEMNLFQWIPFVGYHEQRHIDQIKEIIETL